MTRSIAIRLLLATAFVLVPLEATANTPDGVVPAEETICDGFDIGPPGLCVAYCEAQDCDAVDGPGCSSLRANLFRATGESTFPCDFEIPPFIIQATSDRPSGTTATTFELAASVVQSRAEVVSWEWSFSDGQQATGPNVSVSFDHAGIFDVEVVATDAGGTTAESGLGLVVFDADRQTPEILGLPALLGDVDGDGSITLRDAHLAAKESGRLAPLTEDERLAANVDFEDGVTTGDVELIALAVLEGSRVANRLLPSGGQPGALVTIASPHLLDPEAFVQVQVGASISRITPSRVVLGYATFPIPLDPSITNSIVVTPGPIDVDLIVDGTVVETFVFDLLAPTDLPEDPKAALEKFLDDVVLALHRAEEAVTREIDELDLPQEDRDIVLGAMLATRLQASANLESMRDLLRHPDGAALAELFLRFANANGLAEAQAEIKALIEGDVASLVSVSSALGGVATTSAAPGDVCTVLVPRVCAFQAVIKALSTTGTVISVACDLLLLAGVAAVVVPADGPLVDAALIFTWIAKCSAVELTLEIPKVVIGLIGSLDMDLRFEATPSSLGADEKASIRALLELFGSDDLCSLVGAGAKASDRVAEKIADQAVGRLLRRKASLRAVQKVFEQLGGDILNAFLLALRDSAQVVIQKSGLDAAISNLAEALCGDFAGADLVIDGASTITGPDPNVGSLTFLSDGTAEYTCPTNPQPGDPNKVTFTAKKDLCGKVQTKMATVSCAVREVRITIGDNGSLNDDIFEVRIDGRTVLTSSVPVRSISTTVQLPVGQTGVQMIGRAAPDGIGTYFISFSGATVVGGDRTSGSDLTPGRVKTFTIEVN